MLSANHTLLIQIANFLILLFVLNLILYKPIRRIIAERRQRMGTLEQAVADLREHSRKSEAAIQQSVVQARKEGFAQKEKLKGDAHKEEVGILQEASSAVAQRMTEAKADLDARMEAVRKELEAQVAAFSKDLAEKVLGRAF
ncbi:ATP synthase B/B' CF(0) [uncultured Desulfatiglans sp.]|uniref:ATP synthase subunit b n=1 Tax=Uncultured Desulfatiglans sp. TaxID=1748965 RepID=A0A653A431_UNCDX|nr:ATP synthase B/B' CF(0) [uncultured Desulfatiglans sp.]